VKIQRNGHVSKKNFVYRYRLRKEHLADLSVVSDDYFAVEEADIVHIEATLATVGGQWWTATPRGNDATAHWLASRRQDGPAAYPAVAQGSPARVDIPATTAADQTNDPEMAHDTPNAGLSDRGSGHPRPRWTSVNSTGRDSTKLSTS
jgi:hypothetical protein